MHILCIHYMQDMVYLCASHHLLWDMHNYFSSIIRITSQLKNGPLLLIAEDLVIWHCTQRYDFKFSTSIIAHIRLSYTIIIYQKRKRRKKDIQRKWKLLGYIWSRKHKAKTKCVESKDDIPYLVKLSTKKIRSETILYAICKSNYLFFWEAPQFHQVEKSLLVKVIADLLPHHPYLSLENLSSSICLILFQYHKAYTSLEKGGII